MNTNFYTSQINRIVSEVKKAVIGKDTIIIKTLLAMLCKGHILIEDIPGVGKTTLALAFSKALGLEHNRMQFTPDVLPSDVTGFNVYNKLKGSFEFKEGSAFCNLFLADSFMGSCTVVAFIGESVSSTSFISGECEISDS